MDKNCLYYLEGLMRIPKKKQDEMNEIVMKLLVKGGIRKLKKMKLAGEEVVVVDLPAVDRYGKIRFDYSIYEKLRRDTGWYNTKDGTLCVADRGYSEYGLVMNLIMTVQESFSETKCCLMYEGKPSVLYGYVELIEIMIGKQLVFPFREGFGDKYNLVKGYDRLTLSRAFQRDCEDEFIDNWENERLDFSADLEKALIDWGNEYSKLEDDEIEGLDIEEMLAEILSLVYEEWKCRYVDKSFVTEFVKNKNKTDYKKAIALYYMLATIDVEYFPELTVTQALCMISYLHDKEDRIQLSAFASLLSNKIHRKEIFGF